MCNLLSFCRQSSVYSSASIWFTLRWTGILKKLPKVTSTFHSPKTRQSSTTANAQKILYIASCFGETTDSTKVKQDEAESIIVELFWPNQVWYPLVLKMLISIPVLLNSKRTLLHPPQSPMQFHPMWPKKETPLVRVTEKHTKLSKTAIKTISASWRDGTEKWYKSHKKNVVEHFA